MNGKTIWLVAGLLSAAWAPAGQGAAIASLHDWCVNVNGINVTTNACNQTPAGTLPTYVDGSHFDFTADSSDPGYPTTVAANNLGYLTVTLGAGMGQFAIAYMDYDLNYNANGSFQDFGTAIGAKPGNVSYELDDPNTSNIFTDFSSNTLANTNNVGTFSGPATPCCDVSWALGVALDVPTGFQDMVTFTVSRTAPTSGFYLRQTNGIDSTQVIYLSETVTSQQVGGGGTPEPATWMLFASGIAGVLLIRKRVAIRNQG